MIISEYTTQPCIGCGETTTFQLDEQDLRAWREGLYAQYAFPYLDDAQRENLISGTHPACWDVIFGEEA